VRGRLGTAARVCVLTACAFGASACSTESAARGESCTRSAQCAAGLACIAGECSADVDAVGEQNDVPMLMPDAPDAGADGSSEGPIDGRASSEDDAG
jgi:hypothetical protein